MVKLKRLWHHLVSSKSSRRVIQKLRVLARNPSFQSESKRDVKVTTSKDTVIDIKTNQSVQNIKPSLEKTEIQGIFEKVNQIVNQVVEMARENAKQAFVVEHVTMAIEELSMAAIKTAEASGGALLFAEGAKEKAETGYQTVNEMSEVMGRLSSSQKRVVEIGGQIGEIARESKLIAINAMLEASRAGQAGAGFMVVARKTQELSGKVAQHLESIQTVIHDSHAHAELNQIKASHVSLSLEAIRMGSGTTSDSMKILNATIAGQSKTLSELSHMTIGVKTRVQEISIKLEAAVVTLSKALCDLRKNLGMPEDVIDVSESAFSESQSVASSQQVDESKSASGGFDEF